MFISELQNGRRELEAFAAAEVRQNEAAGEVELHCICSMKLIIKPVKFMNYQLHLDNLTALDKEAGEISGSWNGDNSGLAEDRAHAADEIVGRVAEIKELLEYLQNN